MQNRRFNNSLAVFFSVTTIYIIFQDMYIIVALSNDIFNEPYTNVITKRKKNTQCTHTML